MVRALRTALFGLLLLIVGCTTLRTDDSILPKPRCALRFATYNVYWQNSSKDKCNPNSITHLIQEINPDIIILQETYCFSATHLEKYFQKKYPYRLFRNCNQKGNEDGLGILSRYPIIKQIYFPPVYGWFPGWLYFVKTPHGIIQILNVHLNPRLIDDDNVGLFLEGLWLTPKYRTDEISYYCKFLDPHLPTIIAGDFNEGDHSAAGNYLTKRNYCDLIMQIPSCIKTWHTRFLCFHFTGRYDRIFIKNGIHPVDCKILQKGYSDHFPVIMDYTFLSDS